MGKRSKHRARKLAAPAAAKPPPQKPVTDTDTAPDYSRKCENCGATPVMPITGMCGPCTFGEAETIDGNW